MPGGLRFVVSTERTAPITPLPIPAGVTRVMLFGGSFDPPHRAHVELAARARDEVLGKDAWLVFVPAARSPHKEAGPSAPDADRVAMLRLATREVSNSAVWTDEIDRSATLAEGAASYTVDTVRRARSLLGVGCDLRLLIGSDQAVAFHRWREPRAILGVCSVMVLLREPCATAERLVAEVRAPGYWSPDEVGAWRDRIVRLSVMAGASTEAREMLRGRKECSVGGNALLHPEVESYARQHGLYEVR